MPPPISPETRQLLTLSFLGVSPQVLRMLSRQGGATDLDSNRLHKIIPALSRLQENGGSEKAEEKTQNQIEHADKCGVKIISAFDKDFPQLLVTLGDSPALLWVRGNFSKMPEKSVAIIGTRSPTKHGLIITSRITKFFVEHGWSIVSGLAVGCDAAAHETALGMDGHTVAVMAHGLHTISPSKNKDLANIILERGGALVSEFPIGVPASAHQFVTRDKTQAALAQGVVMVQSTLKGGSLHATRAALSIGRWVAVPRPTELDQHNNDPKIQANLVVVNGTTEEKLELLRCKAAQLKQIRIINSRDDYLGLLQPAGQGQAAPNFQQPIFM